MRKGKVSGRISRETGRVWAHRLAPAAYFLLVLGMYLSLLNGQSFVDELDVFYGGYSVSRGADVYKVYLSQHMPFSYYMAALPALFGAWTVGQFRLGMYLELSALWTGLYLRHRRKMPGVVFLLLPLLYLSQLRYLTLGMTMISDHWQGIGLVMILFEILRYREHQLVSAPGRGKNALRDADAGIPVPMAVMVSLGILLSLGTTFVSAYPVFVFFLGFAAMAARKYWTARKGWRERPEAGKAERKRFWMEVLRLVLICAGPFVLLGAWYAVSGNLMNFYQGAYDINVRVYSQYMGGLGSDAAGAAQSVLPVLNATVIGAAEGWLVWPETLLWVLAELLGILWCAMWVGRKHPAAGIAVVLATVLAGVRGFDQYHAMAFICLSLAELCWCLGQSMEILRGKAGGKPAWACGAAITAGAVLLALPMASDAATVLREPEVISRGTESENTWILEALTERGDTVHACGINVYGPDMMRLGLVPDEACLGATTPWFWEEFGERELAAIRAHAPAIVLYDEEAELWNYQYQEFGADFFHYLMENYRPLTPLSAPDAPSDAENAALGGDVWIRNDAWAEARECLQKRKGRVGTATLTATMTIDSGHPHPGETLTQRFTAAGRTILDIQFKVATYSGRNRGDLWAELADGETGEVLAAHRVPWQDMQDMSYASTGLEAPVEPGRAYELRLTAEGSQDPLQLSWYHTAGEDPGEEAGATLNGVATGWNLDIQVEYAMDWETLEIIQ